MKGLAEFRKRILIHCSVLGAVGEIISLPLIGFDLRFLIGIAVGTLAIMAGFSAMVWSGRLLLVARRIGPMVGGYFLRIICYGVLFYLCIRYGGKWCALGCGIGYLTLAVSILLIYGIECNLPGARRNPLLEGEETGHWRDPSEWEDPAEEDDYKDL